MKFWRRKPRFAYTFRGISEHDIYLNPGGSLTISDWGVTIWLSEGGLIEFLPEMTDEQMSARGEREIRAKYGLVDRSLIH